MEHTGGLPTVGSRHYNTGKQTQGIMNHRNMKMVWRISFATAVIISGTTIATAREPASSIKSLPSEISRKCNTPIDWVKVGTGRSVMLQPSPDASYGKVDCVLAELRRKGDIDLGFIGNEADPNEVISPPWSYIAGGKIDVLQALATEIQKAGWVLGSLAKADDGTGFLLFRTPDGMTAAQAELFNDRIWKQQLGDITFGTAPTKTGSRLIGDE